MSNVPPEVEAVWGGGRLDGCGNLAIDTAKVLIQGWGLKVFLNSSIHRNAKSSRDGDRRKLDYLKQYLKDVARR